MNRNKFDILEDPNPVLRMPTKEVTEFDLSLQQIIDKMVTTLRAENGVGLAAPQVGLLSKIIVLECRSDKKDPEELKKLQESGETFPLTVIINPIIEAFSQEADESVEGCLSFPNLKAVVKRPKLVVISGLDRWGKPIKIQACGFFSRAIQHEADHLVGILLVDRIRKLKLVMISNMELGLPAIKMMLDNPMFDFQYLVTGKKPESRGSSVNMATEAKKLELPVVNFKSESQLFQKLQATKPDIVVVAGFGEILSDRIINLPVYGSLNIHPSLLPKYRGPSPIVQTLLDGFQDSGVTIIKMTKGVDAGPIVGEMAVKLSGFEDAQVLLNSLSSIGAEILIDIIPYYVTGDLKPQEQEHKAATYSKMVKKEDGLIKKDDTPELIERKIRAYYGWPFAYTLAGGRRVQLLRSHLDRHGKLVLDKVKPEGRSEMTYEEYRRGYKEPLDNLEDKLAK